MARRGGLDFGLSNPKISCEDRAMLAFAGFVSFILLFDGVSATLSRSDVTLHAARRPHRLLLLPTRP
jgi:hypothetical protein